MSSYSAGLLTRAQSERAVVLPVVCVMIAGVIGLVALAVDLGAHFLSIQRRSVVLDLAALSASDLHMRGASETEIRNHIQYLVNANDSFNAAQPVEWLQNQDLEIDVSEEVNAAKVSVSRPTPLRTYFAGIFGPGSGVTSEITSSAAYEMTASSEEPVHLVLMLDGSYYAAKQYGEGCSTGASGIPCAAQQDETQYCAPGCASALDVERELARTVARELSKDDRLSLINFAGAARVLAKELVGGPELAETVEGLLSEVAISPTADVDWYYGETADTAVPMFLARELLAQSSFSGNQALVLGTTAYPVHNFYNTEHYIENTMIYNPLEGYVHGWDIFVPDGSQEIEAKLESAACSTDTFSDCQNLRMALCWTEEECALLRDNCARNPATYVEQLTGILAASLQERFFARIYTVDVGFGYEKGIDPIVLSPARRRNFLVELANDGGKMLQAPNNRLDCGGQRPPAEQGRHYEAQPSGSDLLRIARDILRHARRPQEGDSEWGDFRSRLIDADEV